MCRFHVGKFEKEWYGLNFDGIYDAGDQYDPPGTNSSGWQRVWLFENAKQMAKEDELRYAKSKRDYAISHGMVSHGKKITEEAPLEAFLYNPKVPAMPEDEDDDEDSGWGDSEYEY